MIHCPMTRENLIKELGIRTQTSELGNMMLASMAHNINKLSHFSANSVTMHGGLCDGQLLAGPRCDLSPTFTTASVVIV